ncbi:MAG: MBL fold metallo-hydrolase [Flavobacteriales bacterium]|nr:MBL fold metallo-hydrolase [Flavobacteriales bacterium]
MRLTFLGTGTSQGVPIIGCRCAVCTSPDPRDQRLRVSVLVEVNGTRILIDAGPDMRQQLLRARVTDLDAVLLTHAHMDHIGGMDDLRAISFLHDPPRPVPIYADPPTTDGVRHTYHYAFGPQRYPGVPEFAMRSIGRDPFQVEGIEVLPVEVMHMNMPVLGFRIGAMAYVTDAKTIAPAERDKLRGLDVLVLNALRKQEHYSHLNLQEALEVVRDVRPRRAYFTHISHWMGLHAEVQRELPDGVILAHDGLVVEVQEG